MIKVLLFGALRDVAGWRETVIEPAPDRLSSLKSQIARRWPRLAEALAGPGVQVALDQVIVRGDAPLNAGTEVAFLPPMSGG